MGDIRNAHIVLFIRPEREGAAWEPRCWFPPSLLFDLKQQHYFEDNVNNEACHYEI